MQKNPTRPSVIGNWFWCDSHGGRTNQAICRERLARNLPYSPCRHCRRFSETGPGPGGVGKRRD